jgi:phage tail sheath gpL-like
MRIVTALLLASTLVIAGQATAQSTGATLQDPVGKVLVNKGDGLVSGKAGTALVDGDRIVTLDKSGAKIVFADGCSVTLEENNIFVINAELGCKALPIASNAAPVAAGGLTTAQGIAIGAGVVGIGLIAGNRGGSSKDNRPISSQ